MKEGTVRLAVGKNYNSLGMTWKGLKITIVEKAEKVLMLKDAVNWGTGRLRLADVIREVNRRITGAPGTGSPILDQNMLPFQKITFSGRF